MPKKHSSMKVKDAFLMNEDTVNESVWNFLQHRGFVCPPPLTGNQRGIDVEAEKNGWRVYVESKGSHANNHDQDTVFRGGQIKVHTYNQIGKLMEYKETFPDKTILIMANPDVGRIRNRAEKIAAGIEALGLVQFWIREDKSVRVAYPEKMKPQLLELNLIDA